MLLERTEKLPEGRGLVFEVKLDGYRAEAIKSGGRVHVRSRKDKDFNARCPTIVQALAAAREARTAQDAVVTARNRYWAHVVRHGCRKSYREIDSRLQLISPGNTRKVAG